MEQLNNLIFFSHKSSIVKVSKLKARRMSAEASDYDLKVWLKSSAWDTKKRLDITARLGIDEEEDPEREIYETIFQDVKVYISKQQLPVSQFLPIPEYFPVCEEEVNKSLLLVENLREAGYSPCSVGSCLDYEQSVLVISTLARYHATMFCYRHHIVLAEVYILQMVQVYFFGLFPACLTI